MRPTTFIFLALGVILTFIGILFVIEILSKYEPKYLDTLIFGITPVGMILFGLTFLGISRILLGFEILNKKKEEEK